MKASRLYFSSLAQLGAIGAGALFLGLAGCAGRPGTSEITYSQVGACTGYDAAGGRVSARQNEAFVIFKIGTIDDSNSGIDFTFVPSRLYVDQSTEKQKAEWIGNLIHRTVSNDPRFAKSMGVPGIAAVLIPPGKKIEPNAFAVVSVGTSTQNGAEEANKKAYELLYESQIIGSEQDPAIRLTKTNATQTTWPQTDDCKAIKLQ